MSDLISRFLAPVTPVEFFGTCWGRKHLAVIRGMPGCNDELLTVEDVDCLLASDQLPAAFVNVVAGGEAVPVEKWSSMRSGARGAERIASPGELFSQYLKGSTLILNQAHSVIPRVSRACRILTSEMEFPVRANIYISPPDAQGFGRHEDPHEVFVFQIYGEKHFSIYPDTSMEVQSHIRAGDLLYLPRGLTHRAHTSASPSLHISLGFHTPYGFSLVEELAAIARRDPRFQRALPTRFSLTEERQSFEREFRQTLADLTEEKTTDILNQSRVRALADSGSAAWPGRLWDLFRMPELTLDTVVVRRPGLVVVLEEDATSACICFAGNRVALPRFLKGCITTILGEKCFAVRNLNGLLSDAGKLDLVRTLIEAGLLSIINGDGPES